MENGQDNPQELQVGKGSQVSIYKIKNCDGRNPNLCVDRIKKIMEGENYTERERLPKPDSPYGIRLFYKQVKNGPANCKLLDEFGIAESESSTSYNMIIFYYKEGCIFALTKGFCGGIVRPHADPNFSHKVAARLLHEPGPKDFTEKMLVGNIRGRLISTKRSQQTDPFALVIYTKLHSKLRKDASIQRLSCFAGITRKPLNMNVEVGLLMVKFNKVFTVTSYPEILEHLHHIDKGLPTQRRVPPPGNQDPSPNEDDSKAYKQYIQAVGSENSGALDAELVKLLQKAKKDGDLLTLNRFDLCHKNEEYLQQFNECTNFQLKRGRELLKTYDKLPYLSTVLANVEFDEDNLMTEFKKYKLRFEHPSPTQEMLLDYIEGEVYHKGVVYWRVMSKWCVITADLFLETQQKFVKILNECLLQPQEDGDLPKIWRVGMSEGAYNLSYDEDNTEYIVGDKATPNSIEVFDILRVGTASTYVYHVKSDFGNTTRDVCSQLLNSVNVTNWSFYQRGDSTKDTLQQLYGMLTKRHETDLAQLQAERTTLTENLENIIRKLGRLTNKKSKTWKDLQLSRKKILNQQMANRRKRIFLKIPRWEDFKAAFQNRMFVLAVAPNANLSLEMQRKQLRDIQFEGWDDREKQRSLHLEKQTLSEVTVDTLLTYSLAKKNDDEVRQLLQSVNVKAPSAGTDGARKVLAEAIIELLKPNKYVTKVEPSHVTAKLLCSTKDGFRLARVGGGLLNAPTTKGIYDLLWPFMSFFESLGAKMEIVRLYKDLESKGMLHRFKICEIRRTEDTPTCTISAGAPPPRGNGYRRKRAPRANGQLKKLKMSKEFAIFQQ